MSKLLLTLRFLALLLSSNLLSAQLPCDTDAAANIVSRARETILGEGYSMAPEQLLSALALLEKCPNTNAQKVAIYEQAAKWQTALERFELAAENLNKARSLCAQNPTQLLDIEFLQARLELAARNDTSCQKTLDAIKTSYPQLPDAKAAEYWILRAKTFYVQTKPSAGIACLDSAEVQLQRHPSFLLQAESWGTRVELYLIGSEFHKGIALADSVLVLMESSTEEGIQEIRCRMFETTGRMARGVVGTREGYARLLKARSIAESIAPYQRVRYLPSVLSMMVYNTFEQHGIEAADTLFLHLQSLIQPERPSHQVFHAEAFSQYARVLNFVGQYEASISYSERSNALLSAIPGNNNQRIAVNYLFTCTSHRLMGDLEYAIVAGKKALEMREKEQPGHIGLGAFYYELLQVYVALCDTTELKATLERFEQLLDSQKNRSNQELYRHALAFCWLEYWRCTKQPLKGIEQAETFLKVSGAKARMQGVITTELEFKICYAYQQAGDFKAAFDRMEPIVARMKKRFQESGNIFYEHYSWVLAQSACNALAVHEHKEDATMLQLAEARCAEAEELLFALRNRNPKEGPRSFITDEFLYKCLLRVRAALFQRTGDQHHVERAFAVSESFQLVDFQQLLTEKHALRFGGVSPGAGKAEREMEQKLAALEAEKSGLRFTEPGPEKDRIAANIELKVAATKISYDSLLTALEKQFPDYYQLKYNLPIINIRSVQKEMLQPGQCLLKIYSFNDTAVCLLIRPDTSLLLMSSFNENVQEQLISFLEGLRHYPESSKLPEAAFALKERAFADAAAQLFNSLISPLEPWLTKEIIIAPSDVFQVLPFEALLVEPAQQLNRPAAWHFWGKDKTISYTSSATIFQLVQKRPALHKNTQNVLAMAPYFESDPGVASSGDLASRQRPDFFSPLPHTGAEAAAVAELLGGTAAAGRNCAIGDFLAKAENYKVLHLATHASAGGNGRPAFISFQPLQQDRRSAMLFESDIYALRLSADLVTLSACETALGTVRHGDGLKGLTRAFTCAGARNVVASLWTVNDAATKGLMINFYRGIKEGRAYNQALSSAKRAFIQENRQYAHPYYWAGFVLNGR